jgi:hypothetical protein
MRMKRAWKEPTMTMFWKYSEGRTRSLLYTLLLASAVLGLAAMGDTICSSRDESERQLGAAAGELVPDPVIQEALHDVARNRSMEDVEAAVDILREEGGERFAHLIPQLIYYEIHGQRTPEEALIVPSIIKHLGIRNSDIARGLIPLVGKCEPETERAVRGFLRETENRGAAPSPDFVLYRGYIEYELRNSRELPRDLVLYLTETEPGLALMTLMRSVIQYDPKQTRPILWAEHQVADVLWKWRHDFLERDKVEDAAVEALRELSHHPRWWARLYVAEIMRQYPAFRADDLMAALIEDPDPSVTTVALSLLTDADEPGARPN